jgi:hypothetical protein
MSKDTRVEHDWDMSHKKKMSIEDEGDIPDFMPPIVDYAESERFVESLRKFSVEEVGNSAWMEQHTRIEKLNIQAHQSAMTNSEEFVLEAILTFDKLDVLIHDLLVIEAWKENVYPELVDRVAGRNNMRIYFVMYHEATLVNLFEVLFYHKHVCQAGGEMMLEMVDYAARKLTRLQSGYNFRAHEPSASMNNGVGTGEGQLPADASAEEKASHAAKTAAAFNEKLANRDPKEELAQQLTEIEFKICISACTIARYMTEHADSLPLNVVSRITDTHDYLILILPLIENPPWTRRTEAGKWQKLNEFKWENVRPIDLLKVTKLEGQPWIALYNLVAKAVFRERYQINNFRKGQLLRVRKYLNEIMLDQLPFLADIMRYMDELAISDVANDDRQNVFMLQQVSATRDSIIKDQNWPAVADKQMNKVFTMTDKDDKDIRKMAEVYADDLAEDVLDPVST